MQGGSSPLGDMSPVGAGKPSARAAPWETGEAFRQGQSTLGTGEARAGAEPYIGLLFYRRGAEKRRSVRKSKQIYVSLIKYSIDNPGAMWYYNHVKIFCCQLPGPKAFSRACSPGRPDTSRINRGRRQGDEL